MLPADYSPDDVSDRLIPPDDLDTQPEQPVSLDDLREIAALCGCTLTQRSLGSRWSSCWRPTMTDYTWSPEFLRNIRARVDVRRLTAEERDLLASPNPEEQKAVDVATEAERQACKDAWGCFEAALARCDQTPEQYEAAARADRLLRLAMAEAATAKTGGG